jgi:hypothetical protein
MTYDMRRQLEIAGDPPRVEGDAILFGGILTTEAPGIIPDPMGEPGRRRTVYEVLPMAACDLSRVEAGGSLPMLYQHIKSDLPIGEWVRVRVEGDRLVADGRLTRREGTVGGATDGEDSPIPVQPITAFRDSVLGRVVRYVSIGYRVSDYERIPAGGRYGDMELDRDLLVARSWTPYEASLVTVPVDPNSMLRAVDRPGRLTCNHRGRFMRRYVVIKRADMVEGQTDQAERMDDGDAIDLLGAVLAAMDDEARTEALIKAIRSMDVDAVGEMLKSIVGRMSVEDQVKFIREYAPEASQKVEQAGAEAEKAYSQAFGDAVRSLPSDAQAFVRQHYYGEKIDRVRAVVEREAKALHRRGLEAERAAGISAGEMVGDADAEAARRRAAAALANPFVGLGRQ